MLFTGKAFLFISYSELENNKACKVQTVMLTFFCLALPWVSSYCSFNLSQSVVRGRNGDSWTISFLAEHNIETLGVSSWLGTPCPHEWERQYSSLLSGVHIYFWYSFVIKRKVGKKCYSVSWLAKDPFCSNPNTVDEEKVCIYLVISLHSG